MGFLNDLGSAINTQFSVGENSTTSLDAVIDGQNQKYGALGSIAGKFDESSERRYLEEGYLRKDPYNAEGKLFDVLFQEPNATILVKKSMFDSVSEGYNLIYMDADEKLYAKAMKILFANKANQISTLEKLSKIQKVTAAVGNISDQLMPLIISLTDTLSDQSNNIPVVSYNQFGDPNPTTNQDVMSLSKVIERVRRLYAYNTTNPITTWITDPTNLFQSQFGQGTGVIEITNFTHIDTNVTNSLEQPGGANFSIADPYEAMSITAWDIEKAISDATNSYYNHKVFQFGQESIAQVINDAQTRLAQLRAGRGAGQIEIIVAPNTVINKRVRAIIDSSGTEIQFTYNSIGGINGSVDVAPEYLRGGAVAGFDGLDPNTSSVGIGPDRNIKPLRAQSELSVFTQLIIATFNQLTLQANSQNAFQMGNKNTNYARRKLSFQFLGKLIIQPMDTVHIYMNSKSRYDNKLMGGLNNMFTGDGILQNLNNTMVNFQNAATTLFNPSGNIQMQSEKAAFVGANFPNYLWALMRNQFVTEKEGTHVFAGVVDTAPSSWQDGKFNVNVSCKDNTTYFDQGLVNFKPSVEVFNGPFFDPLTPFKTTFDTITSQAKSNTPELLDENKALLGTSKSGAPAFLKYKLGPRTGQAAYDDNITQNHYIDVVTGSPNKVFYAPDGLVYKWKEGIGILTQFGSSADITGANTGNPNIMQDPFAGQDIMNVISLLVTGIPYNFATYWKATTSSDSAKRDPQSLQDSAHSFYASLKASLAKSNTTWGNFIPYKNLMMDEQSFAVQIQGQARANSDNQELDNMIQQYADLKRKRDQFGAAPGDIKASLNPYELEANKQLDALMQKILSKINTLQKSDQSFSAGALSPNGDPTFESGQFDTQVDSKQSLSDAAQRRALRRQLNYLTRRMSYNVRANEDKNLFIVDDSYDKDYDILAYEKAVNGEIKAYNNEFLSVKEKIMVTAQLLNLEVFADTQGHIRVRSPQYNRMPSSIFYRMLYLKKAYGIQIYPQYLEDMFKNQIDTLVSRLEVLENQIRLDCAVMGFNTDSDCINFILNGNSAAPGNKYSGSGVNSSGEVFGFISNEGNAPFYSFKITDVSTLVQAANPDNHNSNIAQSLQSQAGSTKVPFGNSERYFALSYALQNNSVPLSNASLTNPQPLANNPRIDALIGAIKTETGQQITNDNFLVSNSLTNNGVAPTAGQTINVFKITKDLSTYIKERQKVLKLLYGAIKNSQEAMSLDKDSSVANDMLTPGVYGNQNTPEMFEHMIEDETYDDYGPGSGSRYIIRRSQIRSLTITETAPPFTMIEVKGQYDPFIQATALPPEANDFPKGGNGLISAAAIDYDTWRRYGFKGCSPISVPFLKDPETQCGPYASMILSRARQNILRGTLTISGNEYQQPGDVIFLQDRQMLFYVNSVRHNFTYGSQFTTTLDLSYGHAPGEYIPTYLDVIGKMLYRNRDIADMNVQRQSSSSANSNMGIIIRDPTNSPLVVNTGDTDKSYTNGYSAANASTISNILYQAAYSINSNATKGNTQTANIELRIYFDSTVQLNIDLQTFAGSVEKLLASPSGLVQKFNANTDTSPPSIPAENIKVVIVKTDDPSETRSPSQKAISTARDMIGVNSISGSGAIQPNNNTSTAIASSQQNNSQQQVKINLFSYIVDAWITYTQVPTNVASSSNG